MNTLAERLKYALKILNITQTELARRINAKPQVIQFICSGKAERTKFAVDISEALDINVTWLVTGRGKLPQPQEFSLNTLPYLSYKEIKSIFINGSSVKDLTIKDFISNESSLFFATTLNDVSMIPKFNLKTELVINPRARISSTSAKEVFVLAYIEKMDFICFRKLETYRKSKILVPLNDEMYKVIELTSRDKIIGVCNRKLPL